MNQVKSESAVPYLVEMSNSHVADEDAVIAHALCILESRVRKPLGQACNPREVSNLLRLWVGGEEREMFGVLIFDVRMQCMHNEILFKGTISASAIYTREIVKLALLNNAHGVIVYHNHPTGNPEPSDADVKVTKKIGKALDTVDIKLIDHIIVTRTVTASFAELGLI